MTLILVPVKTNISMERTTFPVESDISIPCDVDGYPLPKVIWYKDNQILHPSEKIQISGSNSVWKSCKNTLFILHIINHLFISITFLFESKSNSWNNYNCMTQIMNIKINVLSIYRETLQIRIPQIRILENLI